MSISGRDAISADTLHSVACIMRQMQSKTADAFATALWSSASEMGHRPSTLSLARQLIRSGAYTRIPQLRKVEARFEELVSSGKDADALTAAGELLFEQGRFDAAVATTRRALQLSERFEWRPYCELCLGKAYVKTGKGDEARRIFDRLAEDGLVEADVELADLLKRRESGEVAQRLYAAACNGRRDMFARLSEMELDGGAMPADQRSTEERRLWAMEWLRLADTRAAY